MNQDIKRDAFGRFAGKSIAGTLLALAAFATTAGYAAWYWTGQAGETEWTAIEAKADEQDGPCVEVMEGVRECSDPILLKRLAVEYPDGIPWAKPTSTSSGAREYMGHLGYDITRYATDPKHEEKVARILDRMPGIRDAKEAEAYIRTKFPKSPVTGHMVADAGNEYGVPLPLVLGILEQDSSMGTAGLGAKTRNPGNVGNDDSGNIRSYPTWSAGVEGVARWLSKHKIAR